MDCQLIQNYMGSSVGQRNQKLLPHSTTTCVLSLNQIIRCQRRDLKHSFSQVSLSQSLGAAVCQSSNNTSLTAVSSMPFQTKMSAQRKMEAVSMSVSIHSGATAVSAGVALYCMRISMTVKKVLNLYCSTLFTANKQHTYWEMMTTQYISMKWLNNILLQLAVITLSTVWAAPLPAPTGQISTQARRHAPGHSPPLLAIASKLYVLLPCFLHNLHVNQVFIHVLIVALLNCKSLFTQLTSEVVTASLVCDDVWLPLLLSSVFCELCCLSVPDKISAICFICSRRSAIQC